MAASISDILSGLGTGTNTNASVSDMLSSLQGSTNPMGTGSSNLFSSQTLDNVGTGIGALSNLFNIYSGFKGLNLAEDQFDFNRNLAETNLQNQSNLTNERLATRQNTRALSRGLSPEQAQAEVAQFMQKYGVSGKVGG